MSKSSARPAIRLRGVRHNNLKNFDLDLPLHQLIVITGLSGSGKSSLAFDTLFAEGQRRYIETFSPYARQFFDRMDKPQVDRIEGIPPAIAIEQRNAVKTTRSTVGTMTEICDYLKMLWPHVAQLHCRQCGRPVRKDSPQQIWEALGGTGGTSSTSSQTSSVERFRAGVETGPRELLITFDVPLSEKLSLDESLALIAKQGYQRILAEGEILRLDELATRNPKLETRNSVLTVVQDRVKLGAANRARFIEACEQAYHFGKGKLAVHFSDNRPFGGADLPVGSEAPAVSRARQPHGSTALPSLTGARQLFSNRFHCAPCDIEYREPTPALFSFNHPLGACPTCKGFGRVISIDYDLALPDRSLTLAQGAVKPWRTGFSAECQADLAKFCKATGVPMNVPFAELPSDQQRLVIEGEPGYGEDEEHEWPRAWYGVKGYFRWLESRAYKMHVRVLLSRYRAYTPCPACGGARFQPETLLYKLPMADGRLTREHTRGASLVNRKSQMTLADFYALPIRDALAVVDEISRHAQSQSAIGERQSPIEIVLSEVRSRLNYLDQVGLGYLTLDRPTRSLSGGETERVNLTTCLGTRLVNTLFVLDEPSVGLHPRDTERLVRILQELRDAGNTVVVVEHEASVMRAADQIVDLGPGRGADGGQVVFQGAYSEILKSGSLTGQYLSGRKRIEVPRRRETIAASPAGSAGTAEAAERSSALVLNETSVSIPSQRDGCARLQLSHATRHNLKNLSAEIPLGRFVCVTGVSGSGKTTLVREVLLPALERNLKSQISNLKSAPGKASDRFDSARTSDAGASGDEEDANDEKLETQNQEVEPVLAGHEHLGRVVLVDQSILGKTPRSNPAVYIGAFDDIREFFAQSEPARQRGLNASAFSFNSAQGQCERCRGAGFEKIEMQFLSDVFIRCPDCDGRRYRNHILEVRVSSPSPVVRGGHPGAKAADYEPLTTDKVWSIADVLDATVDEVADFLAGSPDSGAARRAVEKLKLLQEVGLGYLRLGQPINTLSGGESQRLKLVRHLAEAGSEGGHDALPRVPADRQVGPTTVGWRRRFMGSQRAGSTLFLFDEPTTGLHFDDVRLLLAVFQRLVDAGHSVIVIEHNLDVIKSADWLIDLGPDAGDEGGRIVAQGTPEQVAACEASHTGRFLRGVLNPSGGAREDGGWKMEDGPRTARPSSILDSPSSVPDSTSSLRIHGAREHNLKNVSLEVPRDRFVVVTGVSGSGKSTLAFDLLFAEGQRRFLDSMNVYARQFVEQLSRPDVDLITGIPPTVSIEQRNSRGGGKSTVATVTEIFHFVRLLLARLGTQYCPDCGVPVGAQTRDEVGRALRRELKQRGDLLLLAPVVKHRKGFHSDVAEWAARHGYAEIRADGKMCSTAEPFRLDRFREHDVEIAVGVLEKGSACVPHAREASRRAGTASERRGEHAGHAGPSPQELVDEALRLGNGTLLALDNHGRTTVHSTERSCPNCGRSFEPLDPKNFSYNSPQGWCPRCSGFGELFYMPEDVDRGAREDAIAESWYDWQEGQREICPECGGARLNPVARAVRLTGARGQGRGVRCRGSGAGRGEELTVESFAQMPVEAAARLFSKLTFTGRGGEIARDILPEIRERLKFLNQVGLGYLQLGRGVPTLSGGENQRIRLAAQLGSNLSGVLYILDEPTIGLHARDNEQLLATLEKLKARGNSILVVEHDEETMRRADYIIDLGPAAGARGGEVVAAGTLAELLRHPESVTGQCLRAHAAHPARGRRRPVPKNPQSAIRNPQSDLRWLTLRGASVHNLKNLTVRFPLGRFVCVTGVSGSGKSTLVRECLLPALQAQLKTRNPKPGTRNLSGFESLKSVYEVDQSPIGRTPRSVPATYVGFFDDIRRLFAQVPEARLRGYSPSRFSFNSSQGRCPECEGAGQLKLEMNFLPPSFVRCETCGGSRFNLETLDIEYRGRNIAQVLELSVEEAMDFFASIPRIRRSLQALGDTGLGYLKLGQTSPTLSGGEAQRVKLVSHLLTGMKENPETRSQKTEGGRPKTESAAQRRLAFEDNRQSAIGNRQSNLFILEEPTIGLHVADVRRLVDVLQRLVDAGHSVLVIEHNLDLIAEADWIIDLGPEGGDGGGQIVAEGTPEDVARSKRSHTGRFLRKVLTRSSAKDRRHARGLAGG